MNRLAQLDRRSKVISFPATAPLAREVAPIRRGNPGWYLAAAAAGLMIGVVSMELSHMLPFGGPAEPAPIVATAPAQTTPGMDDASLLDITYDRPSIGGLHALDDMTPRLEVTLASNR
jgi:hypothetical protein